MTPMTRFKNQVAIVRKELKRIGFRNVQLNKAQADWFDVSSYDNPTLPVNKRAITQDFLELFTYNLPEKSKFATIGFSYSYQDLDEKDFTVQISCMHKQRTVNKHVNTFIQNKIEAGFESKALSLFEFKDFITKFTEEISKENANHKDVFKWLHENYNDFSFTVDDNLQKRRANIKPI